MYLPVILCQYFCAEPVFTDDMASIDVLTTRFFSYDKMYSQKVREQSFVDWPFKEECNCTPEKVRRRMCLIKEPVKSSGNTN